MEFEVASLTNKLNAILAELQSKAPCPIVAESDISPQTSDIIHHTSAIIYHSPVPLAFVRWNYNIVYHMFVD